VLDGGVPDPDGFLTPGEGIIWGSNPQLKHAIAIFMLPLGEYERGAIFHFLPNSFGLCFWSLFYLLHFTPIATSLLVEFHRHHHHQQQQQRQRKEKRLHHFDIKCSWCAILLSSSIKKVLTF